MATTFSRFYLQILRQLLHILQVELLLQVFLDDIGVYAFVLLTAAFLEIERSWLTYSIRHGLIVDR